MPKLRGGEGLQGVKAGSGSGVYFQGMLSKRHAPVVCNAKDLSVGEYRERDTQEGNSWLNPLLPVEGSSKCNGGLLWRCHHSVGGEPLLQLAEINLKSVFGLTYERVPRQDRQVIGI